jgi:hypothetical protein
LVFDSSAVYWRPRWGWGSRLSLANVTSVRLLDVKRVGRDQRADRVIFVCRAGADGIVELSCTDRDSAGATALIERAAELPASDSAQVNRRSLPTRLTVYVPAWAAASLLVFLLSTTISAYVLVAGKTAFADVTAFPGSSDQCLASWIDPRSGRPAEGEITCPGSIRTGTRVQVLTGPPPFDVIAMTDINVLGQVFVGLPGGAALLAVAVIGWNAVERRRVGRTGSLSDVGMPRWR